MPTGYGIRDHHLFVIDIHTYLLIGMGPPRTHQAASRKVKYLPQVVTKYIASLKENILRHCLIEKLGMAHTLGTSKEDTQRMINLIDEEGVQYMTHAKRNCQRLKSGRICFSLEAVIWIKRE
jgi:hypothetical protein